MKKLKVLIRPTIFLAITMFSAVYVSGQGLGFRVDTTHHSMLVGLESQFMIRDSVKGVVAYQKKDSALVVLDSSATISILMTSIKEFQEQFLKESKELWATKDILSCINTQGYVLNKDRLKFNKATKDYFNLIGRKKPFQEMQKLDILIRDVKGKAVGWVSQ